MKFNPSTKVLLSNEGVLVKKLHCPYGIKWDGLQRAQTPNRYCDLCGKTIINIQNLTDEAVIETVKNNPLACLRVDIRNPNIRVVNHNVQCDKEYEQP